MKKYKNSSYNRKELILIANYSIKFLYLFQIIIPIFHGCEADKPFLKGTSCIEYCSESELKEKKCIIDNNIINTQFLNNIIWIGDNNFRYVNIASYSKKDMIIETTSKPGSSKRMFFGIKKNGRGLFLKNGNYTYYYSIEASKQTGNNGNIRFEGDIFTAIINGGDNNGKEYLVSIGNNNQYIELYDFDNDEIYQKSTYDFFKTNKTSIRGVAINYESNKEYLILYGYLSDDGSKLHLKKLKFTSLEITNSNSNPKTTSITPINYVYGKSMSCFMTDSRNIACMYLYYLNSLKNFFLYLDIFDENFNEITKFNFPNSYINEYSFYKCLHLSEEAGLFAYFYMLNNNKYDTTQNLYIYIKKIDGTQLINYFDFSEIYLKEVKFNTNCSLNDIILITEQKICYVSTSDNREALYIVLINIIDKKEFILRYYTTNLYSLYQYKIFWELRANSYNNFLSIAFSFCKSNQCSEDDNLHYSAFMIFSYPNGTDTTLNLKDFLLSNNDSNINNITINLVETAYIENNIFGYVFSRILIKEKIGCEDINLLSTKYKEVIIEGDYGLEEAENIKIEFKNKEYFNNINCTIQYGYIATEPTFEEYEKFITIKVGDDENYFNKEIGKYEGKTIYYNIILENDLLTNCQIKNCDLCVKDLEICITCKYNSTFVINDNKIYNKTCIDEEILIIPDTTDMDKFEEEKEKEQEKEKEKENFIEEKSDEINKNIENEISNNPLTLFTFKLKIF